MVIVSGPAAATARAASAVRPLVLLRYFVAIGAGNLAWEFAHLPLYTIWQTASGGQIVYAAVHCWLGDLLIAAACLGVAVLTTNRSWPTGGYLRAAIAATALGVASTIVLEWVNVDVLNDWAYAPSMPTLPILGTGLSPLLQWLVLPPLAFVLARPHGLKNA